MSDLVCLDVVFKVTLHVQLLHIWSLTWQ